MTEIVAMELLYSCRGPEDYSARWEDLHKLPWLPLDADVATEAISLQRRLAERGQHRQPIPDLLVAATAIVNDRSEERRVGKECRSRGCTDDATKRARE